MQKSRGAKAGGLGTDEGALVQRYVLAQPVQYNV